MDKLFKLIVIYMLICTVYSYNPIVRTTQGDVIGIRTEKSLQFRGIPFAAPPIGPLRWKKPVKSTSWQPNLYNATYFRDGCPQKYCTKYLPNQTCPPKTSEDCLYLNVWTPLDATSTSGYPVMVFIHGGSFKWGTGSSPVYDGSNLVAQGQVVVVNMDYRLGLLGFLYTGDGPSESNGNFGIQDQRLALQWVQTNIGYFGGDPKKVTLFGESAGAQSAFIHMMSSKSDGLFRAAIMESAPFAVPYREKNDALLLADKVREILKCPKDDVTACMRGKTVDEINDAQEEITTRITSKNINEYYEPIGPIIDGDELTNQPMTAVARGQFRKIPVMLGTNTEEAVLFVYMFLKRNLTKTEYRAALAIVHPSQFEEIERFYAPKPDLKDYRAALSEVVTDYLFTCANRNVTRNMLKQRDDQAHLYVFDHATVARGSWGQNTFCEGHVCHAAELSYVFHNQIVGQPTADETLLADRMVMFWTNFAISLNPNIGRRSPALDWPLYNATSSSTIHFKTPKDDILSDYRSGYCNFWDMLGYGQIQ